MARSSVIRRPLIVTLIVAGSVLAAASAAFAQAQESRLEGKVRAGDEVVIPADETVEHNLYVSGGRVRVEGRIEGDLVAAGGQVDVLGEVAGDALLAGGTVNVSGDIQGDVRVGAGQFVISSAVGGDVVIGAGQGVVTSAASIGEDLVFSAGQMTMDGAVAGSVLGQAGDYRESGSVAGAVDVAVSEPPAPPTVADRAAGAARRYASLLIFGALLLVIAPRVLRSGAESLRREPLKDLGLGALGYIAAIAAVLVIAFAMILLAIALGLLQLGGLVVAGLVGGLLTIAVIVFALVVVSAFFAQTLVGLWLGRFAVGDAGWLRAFLALAVGALAIVVLTAIPYVGPVVRLLVALFGMGALLLAVYRRMRPPRSPQAMPPAHAAPVVQ
ncbi:MAG TPA: hypothetical protein VML96_12345 [Egibacteraceae bacterium]|nr:hypothetical protein [Egibacteraceae bacterium]